MNSVKMNHHLNDNFEELTTFNLVDRAGELDAVTKILLSISQYQHCFYIVQDQEDWLIYSSQRGKKDFCYRLSSMPLDFKVDNPLVAKTQLFENLQHIIERVLDNQAVSISVFKVYDLKLNDYIYIIGYSEQQHQINQVQLETLNLYLQQHKRAVDTYLESQNLKLQVIEMENISKGLEKYFSIISHDLRAPFHGIMGCADILLHESDTLDQSATYRLVQYIYDTSQSTYTLLQGLLHWSMTEGGKFHANPIHFRLNDIVQNVFDLLFASAYSKQIDLSGDISPSLFVYADIHMITSILQNLISNALKFTCAKENRKILISAENIDDKIQIVIKDAGMGMTTQQVERLLQDAPSAMSTVGTLGEQGIGLGLTLSKQFLSMNNGSMSLTSALNQGTCITLTLPLGYKDA